MRSYLTLDDSQSRTEVSRSKFLGFIFRLNAPGDAQNILQRLKKEHSSATHICYAFNEELTEGYRFSDDGEPSKTAGYPIMEVLSRGGYKKALAVVVRYYGGVKLGTGGLARAYSECAAEAVRAARVIEMSCASIMELKLDYTLFSHGQAALVSGGIKILETNYDSLVRLKLAAKDADDASGLIQKLFAGKAELKIIGGEYIELT